MNRQEIVIRAIEFDGPEHVPLIFPIFRDADVAFLPLLIADPVTGWDGHRSGEDEWGCYWTVMGETIGQVTGHPLADWDNFETYKFPDPYNEKRFSKVEEAKKQIKEQKYLMGNVWFTLFERMHFLRGFPNLLIDLNRDKRKVLILADRILDIQIEIVKQWADFGVDGIAFTDDWGGRERTFIHPKIFREIFKPRYKRLFDSVHREGMHAYLHSDGKINEIIHDLVEAKLDVLHNPTPRLLGINNLARSIGGKMCFCCCCDNQSTMIYGTKAEIRKEAKYLVDALGCFKGGFIAIMSNGTLKVDPKKHRIMYEAFREFGKYHQKIS
jgi:uroporphyrinogen-III decarboxylase